MADGGDRDLQALQQLLSKKDKFYQKEIAKQKKDYEKQIYQLQKQLASVTKKLDHYKELERKVGFRRRKRPNPIEQHADQIEQQPETPEF